MSDMINGGSNGGASGGASQGNPAAQGGQATGGDQAPVTLQPGSPATGNGGSGNVPSSWTTSLSPELRGYVELKGFKDAGALAESYQNLEKLRGVPADKLLTLPSDDKPESMAPIYDRLGRPKDPAGYEFKEEAGIKNDEALTNWARPLFHELGLSKAQGEKLVAAWNKQAGGNSTAAAEANQLAVAASHENLKREWGTNYNQNLSAAKKAAQTFGLDQATLDKIEAAAGFEGVMKVMHNIGSRLGEDTFHGAGKGEGGNGLGMGVDAAKARIEQIKGDKAFGDKLRAGDLSAKTEWDNLHKVAFPG